MSLRRAYRRRRKRNEELSYWRARREEEGELRAGHYEPIFAGLAGLGREFYTGKDVLDVGCGPRGSLNWADDARRRVGLDPLADDYRELGTGAHAMEYVAAAAERMPFEDAAFDVVTSFNSLDHVDDLDAAIAEIKRVLRPGGHLVLAVEVGHEPTWSEPQALGWDVATRFAPELEPVRVAEYERGEESLYDAAFRGETFDHADPAPRTGVLIGLLRRR